VTKTEEKIASAERVGVVVLLPDLIIGWVNERLERGDGHPEAFKAVADRIVHEGYSDEFVRKFSFSIVRELYQDRARRQRQQSLGGKIDEQGHHQQNSTQLQTAEAALDALYWIDGRGIRLGDLNKDLCQRLQREFTVTARAHLQEAAFFGRLAQNLKKDQIVRKKLNDKQVRSLWESCRVAD